MYNQQLKNLTDEALLSMLVKESSSELLSSYPTLKELPNAKIEDLKSIRGIGPIKAAELLAAVELGRRIFAETQKKITIIRSPQDVYNLVGPELKLSDREVFKVLSLSTKNHIISEDLISVGSLNATIVHPREVYKIAIKKTAAAILAIHCHPSGDPEPSKEDVEISKRLHECGKLLGIELLDHVIIGDGRYCSLKEKGLI